MNNKQKMLNVLYCHRQRLMIHIIKFSEELIQRGIHHDDSKFEDEELPYYSNVIDEFEKHKFGTPEYNKAKDSVYEAVQHHYKKNRHHPEHFPNGIDDMNLVDLIELLVDWKSASLNHPDKPGNILESLKWATEKYNISPQMVKILYNTIIDFKLEK